MPSFHRVRYLALLALASLLLASVPVSAATSGPVITADGTICTLANAILTSNRNVNTGGCVAVGPRALVETIELNYNVTLTTRDLTAGDAADQRYGPNGLPRIEGHLIINANWYTIQRDPQLFSAANGGDGADPCSGDGEKFRVMQVSPGGNLTLNHTTVSNGCSDQWGGGGILHEGHYLELNGVEVAHNSALVGGGILAHAGTTVLNDYTQLVGNSAIAGAGLYVRSGTVRIDTSLLDANKAIAAGGTVCVESAKSKSCLPRGSGGAIALNGGTMTVTHSTFINNVAFAGAGLYNGGATANVTGALVTANQAVEGGFLSNQRGSVVLTNVTAFFNSANDGGVVNNAGAGRTIIRHATFTLNSATNGASVFASNKRLLTVSNTILDEPDEGNCAFGTGASLVSAGHNLSTDATCGLTQATDRQGVADLGLGTPLDFGGPAGGYFPPLAGSPAIDTGSLDSTPTDQLGQARVGVPDIGAIEYPRFVKLWLGAVESADKTLRLDVRAEMFVDGVPATPGQLNNVAIGGVGFANATLLTVPVPAVDATDALLEITLSVRRACGASGPASGAVRFWFDGMMVDSGPGKDAGSRAGATASGTTQVYFLRDGFGLSNEPGSGGPYNKFIDVAIDSSVPCTGTGRPFTPIGTWSGRP